MKKKQFNDLVGLASGASFVKPIDIERRKNRLLKFCYVPATSVAHNRLLFFFFAAAVYSTIVANKAGLKQSIFLDVYDKTIQTIFYLF